MLIRLNRGDRFANDFEVIRLVAEGGMGTVYAVHDHAVGEVRALKLLLPELVADETSRRRFTQEARVASSIESPHVPQVFRGGIDPVSVTPYIVMELLSGEDLRDRIQRDGAMRPGEVLWVLGQLTHALAAAHRAGIVHRDLKPENVYLHRDAEGESSVKLLDFGVAKLIEVHRTSATGTGAVGSPMWMAPEQTSSGGRIAPATDIWALGLLTFYILTGKLFWKAMNDHTGVTGLLREIHLDPIPSASERAHELAPGITLPHGFDDWFRIAVARDGSERFCDAGPAMTALGPILERSSLAHATTLAFDNSQRNPAMSPSALASQLAAASTLAGSAPILPVLPDDTVDEAAMMAFESPVDRPDEGPIVPETRSPDDPDGLPRVALPVETEPVHPSSLATSSQPMLPALSPKRSAGLSPVIWVVALLFAGFAVSFVSALFVWVVLELGSP